MATLSAMVRCHSPSFSSAETWMRGTPLPRNLSALPIRFWNSCASCISSASTLGNGSQVTAALDSRITAAVPFNFGGPQPETSYPLPPEADQLLKVVAIKGLCREAHVAKIDVGPKGAVVTFRNDDFPDPAGLISFIGKNQGALHREPGWHSRPRHTLIFDGDTMVTKSQF